MIISIKQKGKVVTELPISSSLEKFLDAKPLFYDTIDYGRMPRIFKRIRQCFDIPEIIHIVGTNGKGTTGRFLATALYRAGMCTGHYTSPHIFSFNERIWRDGDDIDDATLEAAHHWLLNILSEEEANALSYFEYTTLLGMRCFAGCDYVVLEAGLGGEHDATAVFDSFMTIATPIDLDHQAFLGDSVAMIARTKLNAAQNRLLLARQIHKEVCDIAKQTAEEKNIEFFHIRDLLERQENDFVKKVVSNLDLPSYLQTNLETAVGAMKLLGVNCDEKSFENAKLFGRMTTIRKNVVVDVGHNPLAAASITKNYQGKKVVLVYNSFKDKDYEKILSILQPIVKRVEILDIENERVEQKEKLQTVLKQLKIQYHDFEEIKEDEFYLVFGSFSVVEEFLKRLYA